jgi:3-methyladenine DNA glycosylase AlkD
MTTDFLRQLNDDIAPAIQPQRAAGMRAYMRDQFDFLGIPTPGRRAAAKSLLKQFKGSGAYALLTQAQVLWDLPQREYQYIALDLLAMHWKELEAEDIPGLLALAQSKSWWDTVDGIAAIVGKVLRGSHTGMDAALSHDNMWVRRIAVLHQLGWRDNTDQQRLFSYALKLAHEKEFFIQKAIGWALRDYARHRPNEVRTFTMAERARLSALSYREANRHLLGDTPVQRKNARLNALCSE